MKYFYFVVLVLFLLLLLIFCLQNMSSVEMSFLGWKQDVPLALLVMLAYVLGTASGWSVLSMLRRSLREVTGKPGS